MTSSERLAVRPRAAIGITVKSGWASAVLVGVTAASPLVLESCRIELSDPALPESRQPYHAGFGSARDPGRERARLIASVKRYGRRSVERMIAGHVKAGYGLSGCGLVVGSLIAPETIANDHIRIHALEGRLFRSVVEDAMSRRGLSCAIWRERDLHGTASAIVPRSEAGLRTILSRCGEDVAGPWRAEQKAATLAAWLVLTDSTAASGRR